MKPELKTVPMEELSPLIVGLIEQNIDVTLTVTGNSMRPMLTHRKDSVVLTKCDPTALKKGDIPLYKRDNGQYVLHRIIKVNGSTYDIIGDHQTEIEYGVPKENVLCVVKAFTRNGKYHSCGDLSFRIYSVLWRWIIPLRGFMMAVHRLPSRLFKRKNKAK